MHCWCRMEPLEHGGEEPVKKYLQAIGIWILIIPLAILNGILEKMCWQYLVPWPDLLRGILLSFLIFAVTYYLIPKIKDCGQKDYIIFGVIWFLLTNIFDLGMFLKNGGWESDLLVPYHFLDGNLWILVPLTTLISPIVVAWMRHLIDRYPVNTP